jgi:hypothetical protein
LLFHFLGIFKLRIYFKTPKGNDTAFDFHLVYNITAVPADASSTIHPKRHRIKLQKALGKLYTSYNPKNLIKDL